MREVVMPPPLVHEHVVRIPDNQCGAPVYDGRDGNAAYHPCMRELNHSGQHSDTKQCPHLFKHWAVTSAMVRCTQTRWHKGKCKTSRYVALDTYGEGEGDDA